MSSFCNNYDPGWLNQPIGIHANTCYNPPVYDDYGTAPHTDSCNPGYSGYADSGGLPLCPTAFQGSFYVDESVCHSNTAFQNVSPHTDIPHGDYCDTYQQWTDTYEQSSSHTNTSHTDSGGASCVGVSSGQMRSNPCSDTYCSSNGCFAQWSSQYFCQSSFCNSHPNYYCYLDGTCFSNSAHGNIPFQNFTNHTDNPASPHIDGCSTHANYAYSQWPNYIHTSHTNFCNHANNS